MIGAIGFTACTGDDGAPGAPGEQGPPGEQGEPGADAGDVEYSYPFLTNWGDSDGNISCSNSLLNETAAFPGPASLEALDMADVRRLDVTCSENVFAAADPDFDGDGAPDGEMVTGLAFNRTHSGAEMGSPVVTPGAGDANPTSNTVNKNFSGGVIVAKMSTTGGSQEAFDRAQLNHDCVDSSGSAPPGIAGEWRGVKIVETDHVLRVDQGDTDTATTGTYVPIVTTAITKTTTKVCVRLDSLLGSVKCYVRETTAGERAGMAAGTTETIGTYSDAALHPVMPAADKDSKLVNPQDDITANDELDASFLGLDAGGDGTLDNDVNAEKVCNLFSEAAPAAGN